MCLKLYFLALLHFKGGRSKIVTYLSGAFMVSVVTRSHAVLLAARANADCEGKSDSQDEVVDRIFEPSGLRADCATGPAFGSVLMDTTSGTEGLRE